DAPTPPPTATPSSAKSPDTSLTNVPIGRHLMSRQIVSDIYRFGGTPLSRMPMFEQYATAPVPNSDQALSEFITLPVHEGLDDSDLNRIVDALEEFGGSAA
ncbi:DegT/DnrJ/EryC1/StrS family aminotransferase, partial [Brachybacterium alimentarium]|uniref:DegT/DnrJ/EryC1/StrS family aminotransferase n=1 Tax=Brachybacterium alimentarium TaxID=47845 RepID=UPI003FD63EA1